MIKGHCTTNLDDYDCSIVGVFAAVPNKGDFIHCKYKGRLTTLKVVSITHSFTQTGDYGSKEPYIIVELHN
jgi:hypothetical protein